MFRKINFRVKRASTHIGREKILRRRYLDPCPYCEEMYRPDQLIEHMGICPSRSLNNQQRSLRNGIPFDTYECPCGEKILKKDRGFHKALNCKLSACCKRKTCSLHDNYKDKRKALEAGTSSAKGNDGLECKGSNRLIQNFRTLLDTEWYSDVVLKTNDSEFRAHRLILGARSPVFASMFQHDMVEKNTGEVDLPDCSSAGLKAFLQFIYTAGADMSPSNVVDLYNIANKYQVDDLKADCIEYMKSSMTVNNFCDVIALSTLHDESELQSVATQFFCHNIKTIVKTSEWEQYLFKDPITANELIKKAIKA